MVPAQVQGRRFSGRLLKRKLCRDASPETTIVPLVSLCSLLSRFLLPIRL